MLKKVALISGVILLVFGLLGFVPNFVTGPGAFFDANKPSSAAYGILGIFLLVKTQKPTRAIKLVGFTFLVWTVLGFLVGRGELFGIFSISAANNWLHLVVGTFLLLFAFSENQDF